MASLPKEAISQLKVFVHLVKSKPELLLLPDLKFFKDYIESFGGKVPEVSTPSSPQAEPKTESKPEPPPPAAEPESEESDIELDNTGVIGESLLSFSAV